MGKKKSERKKGFGASFSPADIFTDIHVAAGVFYFTYTGSLSILADPTLDLSLVTYSVA